MTMQNLSSKLPKYMMCTPRPNSWMLELIRNIALLFLTKRLWVLFLKKSQLKPALMGGTLSEWSDEAGKTLRKRKAFEKDHFQGFFQLIIFFLKTDAGVDGTPRLFWKSWARNSAAPIFPITFVSCVPSRSCRLLKIQETGFGKMPRWQEGLFC